MCQVYDTCMLRHIPWRDALSIAAECHLLMAQQRLYNIKLCILLHNDERITPQHTRSCPTKHNLANQI